MPHAESNLRHALWQLAHRSDVRKYYTVRGIIPLWKGQSMTKALSMTQMLLIAVPAAIFALVALAAMWRGERVMQEEMSVTQMLTIVVLSAMFGIGALALALWLV